MPNLLLKEWMVNRSTILLLIVLALIGFLLFKGQNTIYIAIMLGCFYPFIGGLTEYRNNNKDDILMNSLPVERKEIVASKYVFALLFGLCLILVVTVINRLVPSFEEHLLFVMPLGISVVGWFVSIYYPLFYLLGPRFSMYVIVVIVMVGSYIIQTMSKAGFKNGFLESFGFVHQFSAEQLSLAFLGITVVVLIISWFISMQLYKHKQF